MQIARAINFLAGAGLIAYLASVSQLNAQSKYPSRSIEIINQYPPGGAADTSFRVIQPYLTKELGTTLVLVSRAGAGGAIATDFVKKAAPDGYTVLHGANPPLTIARATNPNLSYKTSDFVAIGRYSVDPSILVSKRNVPWKNLTELIAYAKANPGKLSYGDGGRGGAGHLMTEIFKQASGIQIEGVHFNGSGPLKTAVLGGHIDLAAGNFSTFLEAAKTGDLVPLVSTAPRQADLPGVPTMKEIGVPEASLDIYLSFFVPNGTPDSIISTLSNALAAVMRNPEAIAQLEKAGLVPDYLDGPATAKLIEMEYEQALKIVRTLKVQQ